MKDRDLRFSDTNSADDSGGRTWGLDGNLFWYVVGGVFVFVVTLLLLFSALKVGFTQSDQPEREMLVAAGKVDVLALHDPHVGVEY